MGPSKMTHLRSGVSAEANSRKVLATTPSVHCNTQRHSQHRHVSLAFYGNSAGNPLAKAIEKERDRQTGRELLNTHSGMCPVRACVSACVYACVCVCTCICMSVYVCMCLNACMCACVRVCVCVCVLSIFICEFVCASVCMQK